MKNVKELDPKEKYIHRDLSWLGFNERVLQEAADESNPLLERLNFMAIFMNNFDEFYMVRLAGMKRLLDMDYHHKDAFGYYPVDLVKEIRVKVEDLHDQAYKLYKKLRKEITTNDINLLSYEKLNKEQQAFADRYFESTLFPMLTPMAVDQGHPVPVLPSKTMAFAVDLTTTDEPRFAVVPIPQSISRVLKLPSSKGEVFILVEDVIRQHLSRLFLGFIIVSSSTFRLVRDSELSGTEEYGPDLLKAIEGEIKKRPKAKVVNLEVSDGASEHILQCLTQAFDYPMDEITHTKGDMNLTFLFSLTKQSDQSALHFDSFVPKKIEYDNIFESLKEKDMLLHLPYQPFHPTVDFIEKAANDENVLAIKMTLYRVNEDSSIIAALKKAAANNKQVTVLVELKARFDEEQNIIWARELEEAGCHVVYGLLGMKIHAKMCLIVRKEEGRIRRYVHLSTGNYNENTANVYTDLAFFTADHDVSRDVSEVFNVITGYSMSTRGNRIVTAPYHLRDYCKRLVDREIDFQKKNQNGLIMAKFNALEDPEIIDKLYEASQQGVKIKLVVRGICALIPGVKDLSETIQVKSVVGRFLEHSRFFIFNNNDHPRMFLSSADWMRRNFDRRIEVLFELNKEETKKEIQSLFDLYWKDSSKTRQLTSDHSYQYKKSSGLQKNVQDLLIQKYEGSA